jgi:hypothetical protein
LQLQIPAAAQIQSNNLDDSNKKSVADFYLDPKLDFSAFVLANQQPSLTATPQR